MNLTIVTDSTPDQEPLSVAEAKSFLRLTNDLDDNDIQDFISAARREAEKINGREFSTKQFTLAMDFFPAGPFRRPLMAEWGPGLYKTFVATSRVIELLDPLISVDSFTWKDSTGTVTTLVANTDYIVDNLKHPGIVAPAYGNHWPCGTPLWPSSAVQITFTCGYTPDTVPANIKQAIRLLVSQWYEDRIPFADKRFVSEIPNSVTDLLNNDKLWRF